MAGTLFLSKKNTTPVDDFIEVKAAIKKYIKNQFSESFKRIEFHEPDKDTFLVEFRKDERKKIYKDDAGNWLMFEGWVFSLDQVLVYDAETLFKLYLQKGEDFISHLDGQFVIKLYDASKKQVLVLNDVLKNHTNFWTETEDYIFFSSFLILSAFIKPAELDPFAFNEYMWRYYIMSERSMLKDVQRLEAAQVYSIKNDQVSKRRYWQWPKQYTNLSFDQSVEKLSNSFVDCANLIGKIGKKPIIELTMGQDSRTVASAFINQNIPFITAIFGKDDFSEVPKVKEMTAKFGLENHHIKLDDSFISNPWESIKNDINLTSAEEPGYLVGRIMHMRRHYLSLSTTAVNGVHGRFYKDGIWNEMYVMNLYREPKSFKVDTFTKYRALNKNYRDDIFSDRYLEIKNQSRAYFSDMIIKSISGLENSPVAIQVDKFDAEHYAAFGQVANTSCNYILDVMSPLLYRRNIELAVTLPAKWRFNLSRIQRGIVYALNPALAGVKTDFGGLDMVPKTTFTMPGFLIKYWYTQSKKMRDKIKNLAGLTTKTQLQKAWDYLPVYKNFLFNREVQDIIHNIKGMDEIIINSTWQKLIQEYSNPEFLTLNRMEYILKIVTVEHFLKEAKNISINWN